MDKYISLELAKKLAEAGCELESEYYTLNGQMVESLKVCGLNNKFQNKYPGEIINIYPAYDILNDICVKYKEDFWGAGVEAVHNGSGYGDEAGRLADVLQLLIDGKKQEAEDYIWENCLFNPKNNE